MLPTCGVFSLVTTGRTQSIYGTVAEHDLGMAHVELVTIWLLFCCFLFVREGAVHIHTRHPFKLIDIYVYMFVCIYVCMHVCMYVCL